MPNPFLMTQERVIVFARFPTPGQVKTRLIPALGTDGAARLHMTLTRRTLEVARQVGSGRSCSSEVHFTGGDAPGMQNLFGNEHHYLEQQGNGLGERLEHAASVAFGQGTKRIVVIGTDCPEMEPSILRSAFDLLLNADIVLGPAIDGGYYLIGLRTNCPELFREIDWSTENVLRQTLENARRLGRSVLQLKPLSDIDVPDDLIACRHILEAFTDGLPEELTHWYASCSTRNVE